MFSIVCACMYMFFHCFDPSFGITTTTTTMITKNKKSIKTKIMKESSDYIKSSVALHAITLLVDVSECGYLEAEKCQPQHSARIRSM